MIEKPSIKLNGHSEETEKDFVALHNQYFVDIDEVYQSQPVAISIGEVHYKGRDYPIAYGSYGDFSCIVGASKSKKTFLKTLLTAAYIGGNSNIYADIIKGHDASGKFVIDIDTEQSEFHSQRVFRRVSEIVGINPSIYKPFALRKMSPDERFAFVDWLFNHSQYVGKIGLVCIDGIADLINDANSLEQSNKIAQKLLEWSAKEKCHIITILHRNFQSKKPTGHIGSAVLKKAETVVFVENEDEFTTVTAEYTRNQPFETFSYTINEDWLPIVTNNSLFNELVNPKINKKNDPKF